MPGDSVPTGRRTEQALGRIIEWLVETYSGISPWDLKVEAWRWNGLALWLDRPG